MAEPFSEDPDVAEWWAIVGGESGAGARVMQKEWVTNLHALCQQYGTAFFFKQWGGRNEEQTDKLVESWMRAVQEQMMLARKAKHLTQAEVAEKVKVHVITYGKWETGRSQPTIEEFAKLSKILDLDLGGLTDTSKLREIDWRIPREGSARNDLQGQVLELIRDWDEEALQDLLTWCSGYDKGLRRGRQA